MSSNSKDKFLEEAHKAIDEIKGYFASNPNGKLSSKENLRYVTERFNRVINLASIAIEGNNISDKLDKRLTSLATKEDIKRIISEHQDRVSTSITEVKNEISSIEKTIAKEKQSGKESSNSRYSDVLKQGIPNPPTTASYTPPPSYSVLVYSNNDRNTSEQTRELLMKKISPRSLGVGIRRLRNIGEGGIAIDCTTDDGARLLDAEISKQRDIGSRYEEKNFPLVKIANVPKSIESSEIQQCVYQQNESIKNLYSERQFHDKVKVKFPMSQRNKEYTSWIIEVPPPLRVLLIKEKRVNLNWSRCPVYDYLPVIQCFKCLAFGHRARTCNEENNSCSHCGDKHLLKDCTRKQDPPSCVNCCRAKHPAKDHNSMSNNCPMLLKAKKEIARRYDYTT
ncbi:uncharacterized protein LOC111622952 [Centruroides sculpturatus]|uniref:uncharacterized protein LOC111622952 n=1 Tax=Centruroides sculpturatus TaxID=218467 RepID=UPI000C6D2103|nr:uncharacterized protein LOC111622952 [Centruroides sculpturatus]